MVQYFLLDEKNYDEKMEEIHRVSVRGIFFVDGKLVTIENSFGEVKLPGGGQEGNETEMETLIREVKEETGYDVIPESAELFLEIEEKRLSTHEPMIWHQFNRIYFCNVKEERGECEFTENEKKYHFHLAYHTIDEAIKKKEELAKKEGCSAWEYREYRTLTMLKDYLSKQ